ncbi:SirB2 family protein [Massilia alkalitolerans]|uniref:SirB2 family protein n=1 Tax=Massilia alkalitolerans TaxID=286638 RepID=UPI0028AA0A85|nr:SirB2 family protein [Massilia alkalitolerans]
MPYIALKHLHVTFVALSGLLFLVRGIWMLRASPRLQQRWARIVPHIVDTLLLASAIGLAVVSHQYPGQMPWLTAKVVGLVAYIVLGTIALKRGRTQGVRTAAFVGALACFAYIVAVAVTKNPLVVF